MNYLENLKVEAEKSIRPLAAEVAKLRKNLVHIKHSAAVESDRATRTAEEIETLKGCAGERLTGGQNDFEKYKTLLRKLTLRLATSREAVDMLNKDIIPRTQKELEAALQKLERQFTGLVGASRAGCETRMAELLAQVVQECDSFMAAVGALGKTFGTSYCGAPPKASSVRIDRLERWLLKPAELVFSAAPAPAAPATSPAVPVDAKPAPVESTLTAAREGSVKADTPRAAVLTPEAIDAAAECPTRDAALLSAEANRARVLLRGFPMATETPLDPAENPPALAENPPEATPVDLDAAPLPLAVGAEAEANTSPTV